MPNEVEASGQGPEAGAPPRRFLRMGGIAFYEDHIVNVDLRRRDRATVQTTLGTHEFEGPAAAEIAAIYGFEWVEPTPAAAPRGVPKRKRAA